jgi:hypothetical protein
MGNYKDMDGDLDSINLSRKGTVQPRSFVPFKSQTTKGLVDVPTGSKGKSETQPIRICDDKCFKCQGHGHYAS